MKTKAEPGKKLNSKRKKGKKTIIELAFLRPLACFDHDFKK